MLPDTVEAISLRMVLSKVLSFRSDGVHVTFDFDLFRAVSVIPRSENGKPELYCIRPHFAYVLLYFKAGFQRSLPVNIMYAIILYI